MVDEVDGGVARQVGGEVRQVHPVDFFGRERFPEVEPEVRLEVEDEGCEPLVVAEGSEEPAEFPGLAEVP